MENKQSSIEKVVRTESKVRGKDVEKESPAEVKPLYTMITPDDEDSTADTSKS